MPLYFAYGANMSVEAMRERCPGGRPLGVAQLMRHRLAVMREGWLTAVRDSNGCVHGVLWELALSDIGALDRYEGVGEGSYVKRTQPVGFQRGDHGHFGSDQRTERGRIHPTASRSGTSLSESGSAHLGDQCRGPGVRLPDRRPRDRLRGTPRAAHTGTAG